MLYRYEGPVYNENDRELDWVNVTTQAVSFAKALTNIKFRLMKNRFHQRIYLDPSFLKEEENGLIVNRMEEALREQVDRQILLKDLYYTDVEDILDGKDILTKLVKIDPEKLLTAYNQAGFINDADNITFPKDSQFTWKATKVYQGKTYDIYHLKGNNYCLIAVPTDDVLELFGDRI